MKKQKKLTGFTLIELLVVIAIIALLASIVLVSLGNARSKARDAKRRVDIQSMAAALELYYADHATYPCTSSNNTCPSSNVNDHSWHANGVGACNSLSGYATTGANGWIPNLSPEYTAVLPTDPSGGCYMYQSNGIDYMVIAFEDVENAANESTDPMRRPSQPNENDYAAYSPGATNW